MATNLSLKMLQVCRVTPFTNSATPLVELALPLTYFDMLWVKSVPVEQLFFYQLAQHESTHTFFNSVLLPKLKHSLSLSLAHYLPIVGNIIWPLGAKKPSILFTPNDRVTLIVAESNSDFNDLRRNEMQDAIAFNPYVPKLAVSNSKAAMIAFQITFFPSQGFSIGISNHHGMSDGKSITTFIKSWAHICKENVSNITTPLPLELTPIFDRTLVDDPQGLGIIFLESRLSSSDPNPKSLKLPRVSRNMEDFVRANFELSRQDVTKLRLKIVSQLNKKEEDLKGMHLSTFVLSYAYTIVSFVKAKQLERKGKVGFGFAADCRSDLDPPLPKSYFGNCILGSFTMVDTETILGKNGTAFVANELSKLIKGLEVRMKNMKVEQEMNNILKIKHIREVSDVVIGVGGSNKFRYYGIDFGWGKPKKFQILAREGIIVMTESRDGNGGLEIGLGLKKNEMEMFRSIFLNDLTLVQNSPYASAL